MCVHIYTILFFCFCMYSVRGYQQTCGTLYPEQWAVGSSGNDNHLHYFTVLPSPSKGHI